MEVINQKEKIIEIDNFGIAIKEWGDPNGTPVLALHGWLDNANSFDKIASLMPETMYLVAIDMAGHGLSSHRSADSSYYIWDYAIDVLKVVEVLGWKNFSIIAHSLGTGVASIIAGSMPNMVNKLVFIDGLGAPFVIPEESIALGFRKSVKSLKMGRKTKLFGFSDPDVAYFKTKQEAIKDRMNTSIGVISYAASETLVDRSLMKVKDGFRWRYDPRIMISQPYQMTEYQAQLFISKINCKTSIILGEKGMFADGLFASRIEKFKNATLHWLPGGHHLHLEEAHKQITIIIKQFFNN